MKKKVLTTKDFLTTGKAFDLILNTEYQMLETTPIPDNLELYYNSEAYISHNTKPKTLFEKAYGIVRNHTVNQKKKLLNKLVIDKGCLLDVGCGTGAFLKIMHDNGWDTCGVEPNSKARNHVASLGINVQTSLQDLKNKSFDVITLWHVLEHLPNLYEAVNQIKMLLKPGGFLIIAVPNFNSFDANYFQSYWAAYDVPRHLWHFSRKSIPKLFAPEFNLIREKPMWFDAFYVSMLSKKYKSGNAFAFMALPVGLYSNFLGLFTKEYSSITYILKKSI
mgnify:CR=1 FL=1